MPLASLLPLAIAVLLAWPTVCRGQQQQFPNDPVPGVNGAFISNQFMELDDISLQHLHNGIDVVTGGGVPVFPPIPAGTTCLVWDIGLDYVMVKATQPQNGELAFYRALHIVPAPNLTINSIMPANMVLGTVDNTENHLHSEIYLVTGPSDQGNQFLVNPQRNAFSMAGQWNIDRRPPTVDLVAVHSAPVGSPTIFEIHAYDQADANPMALNGVYAITLYVDDVVVDALAFDRMAKKDGTYPPNASDYYYCTSPACTPPQVGLNNPNVLQYRLAWTAHDGLQHLWRIDVSDAPGNLLHGDPVSGLPGNQGPTVSLGGSIADGKVSLLWRITPSDLQQNDIRSFSIWSSDSRWGTYSLLEDTPIEASTGQEDYQCSADVPSVPDSLYCRLTGLAGNGSTFILGHTALAGAHPRDALQAFPNPVMASEYTILLSLAKPGLADVRIYDLAGRLVRSVHRGELAAGSRRLRWDGRDDQGHVQPNGVYILSVTTEFGPHWKPQKVVLYR